MVSGQPVLFRIWVLARPDVRTACDGLKVRCKRLQPGSFGADVSLRELVSGVRDKRERPADDGRTERRHGLAGDELPRPTGPPTQAAGVRSRLGAL